jgi:hypothetical protein
MRITVSSFSSAVESWGIFQGIFVFVFLLQAVGLLFFKHRWSAPLSEIHASADTSGEATSRAPWGKGAEFHEIYQSDATTSHKLRDFVSQQPGEI